MDQDPIYYDNTIPHEEQTNKTRFPCVAMWERGAWQPVLVRPRQAGWQAGRQTGADKAERGRGGEYDGTNNQDEGTSVQHKYQAKQCRAGRLSQMESTTIATTPCPSILPGRNKLLGRGCGQRICRAGESIWRPPEWVGARLARLARLVLGWLVRLAAFREFRQRSHRPYPKCGGRHNPETVPQPLW
jgi:hypothetical protein